MGARRIIIGSVTKRYPHYCRATLSALGAPERCSKAESGEPEVPPIPYTGFGPKWANSILQETT
eukprot:12158366-Alexandrium_andersonii.AAC.1